MPFVYLIKRSLPSKWGDFPCYMRPDGKFNGGHSEAKQYETKEEAEAKAFLLTVKYPAWIGNLHVVRSAPF